MLRFLAPLILAPVLACATTPGAGPEGPATAADYAPLKVGASWTYAVKFPGQAGERTITILEEKDGYFVDSAGGALRHTPEGLRDQVRFLLRNPLTVGATWKAVVSASAVEHYTLEGVGEPCTAQAGAFTDCLVVAGSIRQDAQHTLHSKFYWARGVGLVKITTALEYQGKIEPQTEQSLMHYNLAPKAAAPAEGEEAPTDEGWSR
ncbi:MAG: hypothetical protein H6730_02800 [Deltaproteobacteria bacterium]|nr:hypothetical protein [Deltaproteobacteria bacterium]